MENIEKAKSFLRERLKIVKRDTPCIILIDNKQVKLASGKSAWKNIGSARAALTSAMSYGGIKYPSIVRKELEKEKIVVFKTIS